ncbi:UDP-N-acetylmuramoyl-L-alanine--D-glutamate ligase [Alicyclobacillus mengziensis]|uniref:UDP-N-acetylmuramoylalanine--D-glutamate ligase n=1 Tax=Alicyclobacillus mengziensis TaxID=2931921 RepID=A0A9X7W2C6_9BACL|nr:UDP-N-acetylmuramoyl-L-alanine--D-glutamate ligase [Alicyclobacillus mengziensis]QSO49466.1 UDP-N-acetylmuramoyl-L-alanine--D-glutamate ligase [Alicyclobacillus mengziensis]
MFDKSANRVIVMGLARSGRAVARLLLQQGFEVVVNDQKYPDEMDAEVQELSDLGAAFVFGGHPLELLKGPVKFLVKNPGIPYRVPLLVAAMEQGIPIYTEIEVASWFFHGPLVAITGSNGKTTTTTLVGEMLKAQAMNPIVAGNIGTAFSAVVSSTDGNHPVVLEVSSFQLLGTEKFHPYVAAILNLYSAHLDYHGDFESYMNAKWKVFANQTKTDFAVLNYDDERLRARAHEVVSQLFWFTTGQLPTSGQGVCVEAGQIVVYFEDERTEVMRVEDLALPGQHNLQNAIAATAVSWLLGARVDAVEQVLKSFRGVEHRLEFVATVRGAAYYNDSKSTNPTAALQALRSLKQPIVWIAGGLDRKDDYSVLGDVLRERVKAAVLYGETADDLTQFCARCDVSHIDRVANLTEAVTRAAQLAQAGDAVLLSPACASWDMFASFEERGRMFKDVVHRL